MTENSKKDDHSAQKSRSDGATFEMIGQALLRLQKDDKPRNAEAIPNLPPPVIQPRT